MNKLKELLIRQRNLILYGIFGSISASLDFVTYYLLTELCGIYYLTSNVMSVFVGIITSFLLNRAYNFKVEDKVVKRFLMFITIGITGLAVSSGILYVLIDKLLLNTLLSKVLSIGLVVIIQFVLNKYITFKNNL